MKNCPQTDTQSVYQHGICVKEHFFKLIVFLKTGHIDDGWRLPDWAHTYREQLLSSLLSEEIIEEYTIYHDCSKPYCLIIEDGKKHFPNHAERSYETWLSVGGDPQAAKLMKMDMIVHTMKADDVDEFTTHPEAITLLLAGLAEIHSNSKMFGGLESVSFKIKWKQINKMGRRICTKLFGDK